MSDLFDYGDEEKEERLSVTTDEDTSSRLQKDDKDGAINGLDEFIPKEKRRKLEIDKNCGKHPGDGWMKADYNVDVLDKEADIIVLDSDSDSDSDDVLLKQIEMEKQHNKVQYEVCSIEKRTKHRKNCDTSASKAAGNDIAIILERWKRNLQPETIVSPSATCCSIDESPSQDIYPVLRRQQLELQQKDKLEYNNIFEKYTMDSSVLPGEGPTIDLILEDSKGHKIDVALALQDPCIKLKRIFWKSATDNDWVPENTDGIRLLFDDEEIKDEQTVQDLDFESGDKIEVYYKKSE